MEENYINEKHKNLDEALRALTALAALLETDDEALAGKILDIRTALMVVTLEKLGK